MNFTINKTIFYNALQIVSHAISPNSPQPQLRGLLINAENDSLVITGSDADISIRKKIVKDEKNMLNIIEEGSILIESRYLLEIVRKIDNEYINVEIIDGALTKFSGSSAVFKINGMNPMDYPNINFSKPDSFINLPVSVLQEIIEQTAFAASIKETRPVLTGVNFRFNDGKLVCTGTDSFRLARKVVPFESDASFNVTIPAKGLNEVKSSVLQNSDSSVELYMDARKAQFINEDTIIQTKLLDGAFPETDRLIPKEFLYTMNISRSDLISAIDRTTFIKTENMAIVRLQCSRDEVILSNKSQEIGESRETLAAQFEGDDLDISFSGSYVIEAARSLKGPQLKIGFTGEMKPFVIFSEGDDSVLQLVLPVKTYN